VLHTTERPDAAGVVVPSTDQKITAATRQLDFSCLADAAAEFVRVNSPVMVVL
jgi:hypothetical protein